ncbi:MAG: TolC family protein [Neisseriaceae bacterium]
MNSNLFLRLIFYFLLVFCNNFLLSNELTISKLEQSIDSCYPKILNASIQQEIAEAKVKQNQSPFDTHLNGYTSQRQGANYNTQYQKVELEKRFYDSPISVYSGYDISSGYAPQYEGSQITSNQGREFVGLRLNLLNGFAIDKERLTLYNSVLETDKAKLEVKLAKLLIKTDAMKAYIAWIISGEQLNAYKDLFEIANRRQKALERKFKAGDVAKIVLTENQNNLLKRKTRVISAENTFNKNALSLSLYSRDSQCKLVTPSLANLPKLVPAPESVKDTMDNVKINEAIKNRPEFKIIDVQLKSIENEQRYAKTENLPKLKATVQYNQNNSQIATTPNFTVNQNELVAKLEFSMPLERSYGSGLDREAYKKLSKLRNERQFLIDQVSTKLNTLYITVNSTADQVSLVKSELQFSRDLLKAENSRFNNGDSSFFMLNTREENLTNSYLSLLNYLLDNYNAYIEYNFLNGNNVNLTNIYNFNIYKGLNFKKLWSN